MGGGGVVAFGWHPASRTKTAIAMVGTGFSKGKRFKVPMLMNYSVLGENAPDFIDFSPKIIIASAQVS